MSTWHQQQAPMRLWHDTLWTLVLDAPGRHTCVERFSTEDAARLTQDRAGGYVLPPGNAQKR
jgi:hypothetical protein